MFKYSSGNFRIKYTKINWSNIKYHNGNLKIQNFVSSVAIRADIFIAVGNNDDSLSYKGENTKVIDLENRTVIPGLNDSHIHIIRGGLNYNLELLWDRVPSLNQALSRIEKQAERTPNPHWIRVVGC